MERKFDFYGSMPEEVLRSYLSRAVTHCGIGSTGFEDPSLTFEDDMRMLVREGAKFIGRAALFWGGAPMPIHEHFRICRERAELAHSVDPQFILQACVFECINKDYVDSVPIPEYVFTAFGLKPEKRNFRYDDMLFSDGRNVDFWKKDSSVEDITQLETRMWIYYLATAYIDAGYEGIHFGQICFIGQADRASGYKCWRETISKVRTYAAEHARRRYVLFDAHTLDELRQDEEMLDYNAFPIRLKDLPEPQYECICEEGYIDSMFNPKDGLCRPFIVEFDNFGIMDDGECDKPHENSHFAWGYDEISWFSKLSKERRSKFLRYIWDWVNERYPDGWVQMPSRRGITRHADDPQKFTWEAPDLKVLESMNIPYTLDENGTAHYESRCYAANNQSPGCPCGFGDEDTIAELFAREI